MTPGLIILALETTLAVVAALRTRSRVSHAPVAIFIGLAGGADGARMLLKSAVLGPARMKLGGLPYLGVARIAFHIDEAMFLAWPLGLALLVFWTFLAPVEEEEAVDARVAHERAETRRVCTRAVTAIYVLGMLALVAGYPTIRGSVLRVVYLAAEFSAVAAALAAAPAWWKRSASPTLADASVLVFVCLQLGATFFWNPAETWDWQRGMYAAAFVTLIIFHVGSLWIRRQTSV